MPSLPPTVDADGFPTLTPTPAPPAAIVTLQPITRILIRMAIPAMLGNLLTLCFNLVDAFWVGYLGASGMAALSSASIVTWILYAFGSIGAVGTQALVAQAVGAGDETMGKQVVAAALWCHVALILALLAPLYLLAPRGMSLLGLDPDVARQATDYLNPFIGGMAAFYLGSIAAAAFQGQGDTRTPALALMGALALNAALDPLLILGPGPFPAWGLFGAALATMLAKIGYSAVMLWLLHRRGLLDRAAFRLPGTQMRALVRRVAAIGTPIALNGVFFASVYLVLVRILSTFGTTPVAVLGVAHRIEGVAYFACVGMGITAATVAGQHYGARQPDEAVRMVWKLCGWLILFLVPVSLGFIFLGESLVRVFIADPSVVREGGRYLLIIGLFEIFMGMEIVFTDALSGVGASRAAFFIATPLTLARIPLAWLLAVRLGYGVSAVWWAIALSTLAKGILLAQTFTKGKWRSRCNV